MRKPSALLLCRLLAFVAIATASFAGTKTKPKTVKANPEILPYCTTPTDFNDRRIDTDAYFMPYESVVHARVKAETIPEAWKIFQSGLASRAARAQLEVFEDFDHLPRIDVQMLAQAVRLQSRDNRAAILRPTSTETLAELCAKVHLYADREDGKHPVVIRQLYFLVALQQITFDGAFANLELRCVPLPAGIAGMVPAELRSSKQLMASVDALLSDPEGQK